MSGMRRLPVVFLLLFAPLCGQAEVSPALISAEVREAFLELARAGDATGFLKKGRCDGVMRRIEAAQTEAQILAVVSDLVQMGFDLQEGEGMLRALGGLLAREDMKRWRKNAFPKSVEVTELTLAGKLVLVGCDASIRRRYPKLTVKQAGGQIHFEPNIGVPGLGNWTIVKEDVKKRRRVRIPLPRLLLDRAVVERITDSGDLAVEGEWLELPCTQVAKRVVLKALRVTTGGTLFANEELAIRCVLPTHRYQELVARHGLEGEFDSTLERTSSPTPVHSKALEAVVEPLLDQVPDAVEYDILNAPADRVKYVLGRRDLIDGDAAASLLRLRFALLYGPDLPPVAIEDPNAFRALEAEVLQALSTGEVPRLLASRPDWKTIASIVRHGRSSLAEARSGEVDGLWVRFPRDYSIWRKWPLLVILHGQYCRPDYDYQVWGDLAEKAGMILVCPRYGSPEGAPRTPDDDAKVLDVIRRMSLHYGIDSDRVYLSGISMGGAKSWSLASRYGDRFAAVAPEIHGPTWKLRVRGRKGLDFFLLPNLDRLPLRVLEGRFDGLNTSYSRLAVKELKSRGALTTYYEAPLIGHERLAWRYPGLLREFQTLRREPLPARLEFRAIHAWSARLAWLEILEIRRPGAWKKRDGHYSYSDVCGVSARCDEGTITIEAKRGKPRKLKIYHAPDVMGEGPLTLRSGRVKRSWRPKATTKFLLEQVIATGDRSRLYTDATTIELPRR